MIDTDDCRAHGKLYMSAATGAGECAALVIEALADEVDRLRNLIVSARVAIGQDDDIPSAVRYLQKMDST